MQLITKRDKATPRLGGTDKNPGGILFFEHHHQNVPSTD